MPLSTPIIQLIDRDPISLDVNNRVSEAAGILASGRFHHLPIVDDKKLVGVISSADIMRISETLFDSEAEVTSAFIDRQYGLRDVMTEDPVTVSDRATVQDAAKALSAGGFHSLPIVDGKAHLVGVITTTDLINHMLEASPRIAPSRELQQRLQALEQVYSAVKHYLHSGLAVQEHARLERAIEKARETDPT